MANITYNLVLKPAADPSKLRGREVRVSVNGGTPTVVQIDITAAKVGPITAPRPASVIHEVRNVALDGTLSAPVAVGLVVTPEVAIAAPAPVEVPDVPDIEYIDAPAPAPAA